MKDPTGRDADNIAYGSTLSNDRHTGQTFDYLIANPRYGKDWKRDEVASRRIRRPARSSRWGSAFAAAAPAMVDFNKSILGSSVDSMEKFQAGVAGKTEDVVVSRIFPTTHFAFRKILRMPAEVTGSS